MSNIFAMFDIEAVRSRGFNEKVQLALGSVFPPTLPLSFPPFSRFLYDHSISVAASFLFTLFVQLFSTFSPIALLPRVPARLTPPCLVVSACHCHGWPYPSITPMAVLHDLSGHK